MSVADLLNSDVGDLWRKSRDVWQWWRRELLGCLPAPLRRRLENRPALTAEIDGPRIALSLAGRPVALARDPGRPRPVTLRLPRALFLVRELRAPPLAAADLRAMLELDIDRLTPFRADEVFLAVEAIAERPSWARLAVARRRDLLAALQAASAAGLAPQFVGIAGVEGDEADIDLLPPMRAAGAAPQASSDTALLWAIAAVLLAANLALAVTLDVVRLNALRNAVEAAAPRANAVRALQRSVLNERRRRADILDQRARAEPLHLLNTLTVAVPDGAWVDRLALDGKSVRIAGFRREDVDVAGALRASPALANVHSAAGTFAPRETAGTPFDLSADVRR